MDIRVKMWFLILLSLNGKCIKSEVSMEVEHDQRMKVGIHQEKVNTRLFSSGTPYAEPPIRDSRFKVRKFYFLLLEQICSLTWLWWNHVRFKEV